MAIRSLGGYAGGGGPPVDPDAIESFLARWPRVAEWRPDNTQTGFPAALFRFAATSDTLVEPIGSTFANSIRHRAFVTPGTVATQAVVLRDALAGGDAGGDGNQSISALTGGEAYGVIRWDAMSALQWGTLGFFASAGVFPFPDVWTLQGAGYGWTSQGTPTPVGDVEVISRGAAGITRQSVVGARAVGSWQVISARLYPPSDPDGARVRVRAFDAQTGAETFDLTNTTDIPAAQRLHAGIIANNGNNGAGAGRGAVGMSVAYWAVGLPS